MLRSENIQVRSQLATIQRRMFQEKQQIMDYLRQIENELVEKEQIRQRESLLREERDQLQLVNQHDREEIERLKNSIERDRVKIEQLEQECSQLLETVRAKDEKNTRLALELDTHKSSTQQLCSHLQLPRDSLPTAEQLISLLEERSQVNRSIHSLVFKFFASLCRLRALRSPTPATSLIIYARTWNE